MNINIDTVISYNVKGVKISNIIVNKNGDNLSFTVPYQWVDEKGKIIKSGVNVYNSNQLVKTFQNIGSNFNPFISIFNSLFLNVKEKSANLVLNIKEQEIDAKIGSSQIVNGISKWVNVAISSADFVKLLNKYNISVNDIKTMLNNIVVSSFN